MDLNQRHLHYLGILFPVITWQSTLVLLVTCPYFHIVLYQTELLQHNGRGGGSRTHGLQVMSLTR